MTASPATPSATRILAVDTSSFHASAAVVEKGGCLCQVNQHTNRPSRTLLPAVEEMLGKEGLSPGDIGAFAVATGPGSFTGVRVGMAAAQAMAFALSKPVIGVPTLDCVALQARERTGLICVLQDARRGRVYAATYEIVDGWPDPRTPPQDVEAAPFLEQLAGHVTLLGDAIEAHPSIERLLPQGSEILPSDPYLACSVGEIAWRKLAAGDQVAAGELQPLYVRPPDARIPAPRAPQSDD